MAMREEREGWRPPTPAEFGEVHEIEPRPTAAELRFAEKARHVRHRRYLRRQRGEPTIGRIVVVLAIGLLIMVVAATVAYFVSDQMERTYAARTQIQFSLPGDESAETATRVLESQALAMRSRSVLEGAAEERNVAVDDLQDHVESRVLPNSSIVEVDVEDHDPATALAILNRLVADYLTPATPSVDSPANAFVTAQLTAIDQRLTEIDQRLAALGPNTTSREALQLQSERSSLVARRDLLLQTGVDLTIRKLSANDVVVLAAPYVLEDPVSPQPVRAAVLAAAVGFVIAAVMAYFLLRRPALT